MAAIVADGPGVAVTVARAGLVGDAQTAAAGGRYDGRKHIRDLPDGDGIKQRIAVYHRRIAGDAITELHGHAAVGECRVKLREIAQRDAETA